MLQEKQCMSRFTELKLVTHAHPVNMSTVWLHSHTIQFSSETENREIGTLEPKAEKHVKQVICEEVTEHMQTVLTRNP